MKTSNRGIFLTLEGIEGVGKSTHSEFIAAWLKERAVPYVLTREPGGTPLAEAIRDLLVQTRSEPMAATTELLLVFAARAQHIQQVIEPALANGKWVVCDRFTDATYAYQGAGRGIPQQNIAMLEQYVQGTLRPDYTIILDVDVALGLQRASKRNTLDRFEREQVTFFNKVRAAYQAMAIENPQRYCLLDASQPLAIVQQNLVQVLDRLVER